jgi:hypothetical protein
MINGVRIRINMAGFIRGITGKEDSMEGQLVLLGGLGTSTASLLSFGAMSFGERGEDD